MKTDLRFGFGDYVQATVAKTDNSLKTRTEGCIALLSTWNPTGSVLMLHLVTNRVVIRDQFKVIPMSDLVVAYLNESARKEGYTRVAVHCCQLRLRLMDALILCSLVFHLTLQGCMTLPLSTWINYSLSKRINRIMKLSSSSSKTRFHPM